MAGRRTLVTELVRGWTLCALLLFGSACGGSADKHEPSTEPLALSSLAADSAARVRQDSINRTAPGYVVDSILPVEEQIRRFQESVGGKGVTELTNGTRSREALIARFRRALASSDTVALLSMLVTPREFIDLVYPESQYTRPPYRQSPALVWQQIQSSSDAGLSRLLARMGGVRIRGERERCEQTPETFGGNTVYSHCTLAVRQPDGSTKPMRLFGPVMERGGRFKLLSYANDF